jgi:hypothetical protein
VRYPDPDVELFIVIALAVLIFGPRTLWRMRQMRRRP